MLKYMHNKEMLWPSHRTRFCPQDNQTAWSAQGLEVRAAPRLHRAAAGTQARLYAPLLSQLDCWTRSFRPPRGWMCFYSFYPHCRCPRRPASHTHTQASTRYSRSAPPTRGIVKGLFSPPSLRCWLLVLCRFQLYPSLHWPKKCMKPPTTTTRRTHLMPDVAGDHACALRDNSVTPVPKNSTASLCIAIADAQEWPQRPGAPRSKHRTPHSPQFWHGFPQRSCVPAP